MTPTSTTRVLEKNLRALATRNRALADRLLETASADHIILSPDGPSLVRHHGVLLPLEVAPGELEVALQAWPEGQPELLLFGLGLGELLAHLLRRRPEGRVTAFERDPWLMHETLSRWDYSGSLESGRLQLVLGVDLALDLERLAALPRVDHPTLGEVYRQELELLEVQETTGQWAAVGLGGHFVDDLAAALRAAGYRVAPVELRRWSDVELRDALARLKPALVVTVNFQEGLDRLCAEQGWPLYVWEVDPSADRLAPPTDPLNTHLFACGRRQVEDLREAGYGGAAHLPLAADPDKRRPVQLDEGEAAHYGASVCFVGDSLAEASLEYRRRFLHLYASWSGGEEAELAEGEELMEGLLAAQRADGSTYVVPELAAEQFSEFLHAARVSRTRQDPVSWLAEIAAAEKRQEYVGDLGEFGVRVWGDEGWADVDSLGGRYMGRADHHEELTRIYSSGAIHVDVNRLCQPNVVSLRVFEVLACGGFLLAEHTDEFEGLFAVGVELETYRTQAELHEKVRYFLAHPDEARAIATLGRAAVLERHTVAHRVRTMLTD
jgi:spore maturation protein CgeB